MKTSKILSIIVVLSLGLIMAAPVKLSAQTALKFKTFDATGFSISLPEEFSTDVTDMDETYFDFRSNAQNVWADGSENESTAVIYVNYQSAGAATPAEMPEYAENIKMVQGMDGWVCEKPKLNGNTLIMRMTKSEDDGETLVGWQYTVVTKTRKAVMGTIEYDINEAAVYDGMVETIVKSIKIK